MSDILSLLTPPRSGNRGPVRRPLVISALFAGLAAPLTLMLPLMALGLVGWFAAGADGDTSGGLRVGADAWLLGHGAHLSVGDATVTLLPLGVTLLALHVCFRFGRWAAHSSDVENAATLGIGVATYAGAVGMVGIVTGVLASTPAAQVGLGRAFVGAFVVGLIGGGLGLVTGSHYGVNLLGRASEGVRAVLIGTVSTVLVVYAVSSVVLTVALVQDLGAATTVLSELHVDATGGLLYTAVTAGVAPNAVLLATAYLLGPGFTFGTGTVVAPTDVILGPVPAFPLLAAFPDAGAPPWWASLLVLLPAVAALCCALWVSRRFPAAGLQVALSRGLLSGAAAAVVLAWSAGFAGGAIGPGRMADIGADVGALMIAALPSLTVGAVLGSVIALWCQHRHHDG
jgi:hypothetical protein